MPIHRMLQTEAFDPETVKMLGECFESVLSELKLTNRTDPLTLLVAQRVIACAHAGERDPGQLRQKVLTSLKT